VRGDVRLAFFGGSLLLLLVELDALLNPRSLFFGFSSEDSLSASSDCFGESGITCDESADNEDDDDDDDDDDAVGAAVGAV
jgi:hypothetical protein